MRTPPQPGTQELKIVCTCLAHDATLLTRNVADFKPVPGLRVENWPDTTNTKNEDLRNLWFE